MPKKKQSTRAYLLRRIEILTNDKKILETQVNNWKRSHDDVARLWEHTNIKLTEANREIYRLNGGAPVQSKTPTHDQLVETKELADIASVRLRKIENQEQQIARMSAVIDGMYELTNAIQRIARHI